jgi:hypothetical protein
MAITRLASANGILSITRLASANGIRDKIVGKRITRLASTNGIRDRNARKF